jgi:hybrid cluster-associated redox disulfide protein
MFFDINLRSIKMIDKNMSIDDVVKKYPETVLVFEQHGLGCIGCQAALFENIEQGAEIHGIDVSALVNDLNKAIAKSL